MDARLRQHLTALTRQFYEQHAQSFSRTRQHGWASWKRILNFLSTAPVSVVDYGCGNGRFLAFLSSSGFEVDYLGLDSDSTLLHIAEGLHPDARFALAEDPASIDRQADLVVSFGLMHHIPGQGPRAQFIRDLASHVREGGTLVLSFWQPESLANFSSKSFTDHGLEGLEANDHLLGWNGNFEQLRYCHSFTNGEIDDLVSQCALNEVTRFSGTGNDATNIYLIATVSSPR